MPKRITMALTVRSQDGRDLTHEDRDRLMAAIRAYCDSQDMQMGDGAILVNVAEEKSGENTAEIR